ncbi:MAG: squalene cyclase [Actinomycetota bacterium]
MPIMGTEYDIDDVDAQVIEWLLDSDPAIRWQLMRDLLDRPEAEWLAERAKVETEGWGAQLLALEDDDGQWAGGAHFPADFEWPGPDSFQGPGKPWLGGGQPWTSTSHVLALLREFGLDPGADRVRRSVNLIGANCRWDYDNLPYWGGEVEPCINGALVANGTYFRVGDMQGVVNRLVGEVLEDGGWNCEAESGSIRSSFNTTINVLEGLLEFEQVTGGTTESREARLSGEEFLLERRLFKRLSTGEPADERFLLLTHPNRWFYDVLRGLDYFRAASATFDSMPDRRIEESVAYIRSRRRVDGRWNLDWSPEGRTWFEIDDGVGKPSKWITLRAFRVLNWWDGARK